MKAPDISPFLNPMQEHCGPPPKSLVKKLEKVLWRFDDRQLEYGAKLLIQRFKSRKWPELSAIIDACCLVKERRSCGRNRKINGEWE